MSSQRPDNSTQHSFPSKILYSNVVSKLRPEANEFVPSQVVSSSGNWVVDKVGDSPDKLQSNRTNKSQQQTGEQLAQFSRGRGRSAQTFSEQRKNHYTPGETAANDSRFNERTNKLAEQTPNNPWNRTDDEKVVNSSKIHDTHESSECREQVHSIQNSDERSRGTGNKNRGRGGAFQGRGRMQNNANDVEQNRVTEAPGERTCKVDSSNRRGNRGRSFYESSNGDMERKHHADRREKRPEINDKYFNNRRNEIQQGVKNYGSNYSRNKNNQKEQRGDWRSRNPASESSENQEGSSDRDKDNKNQDMAGGGKISGHSRERNDKIDGTFDNRKDVQEEHKESIAIEMQDVNKNVTKQEFNQGQGDTSGKPRRREDRNKWPDSMKSNDIIKSDKVTNEEDWENEIAESSRDHKQELQVNHNRNKCSDSIKSDDLTKSEKVTSKDEDWENKIGDSSWDDKDTLRNENLQPKVQVSRSDFPDQFGSTKSKNIKTYKEQMSPNARRDADFDKYDRFRKNHNIEFTKVKEIEADLFTMGGEYSLAHCVAEDMNMGSGVAITFRQNFGQVDTLLEQRKKQGDCAYLKHNDIYVYYLVTKRESSKKPTIETMYKSMQTWKRLVLEHKVTKIAVPRLGCGLDRLDWDDVKMMLEFTFIDTDVQITVCNFQQAEQETKRRSDSHRSRKCKVVSELKDITEIAGPCIILYFGSVDGALTPEIERLNTKFATVGKSYKGANRKLGEIVRVFSGDYTYAYYGCIVKNRVQDQISFEAFGTCLKAIKKENYKFAKKQEHYSYAAIQHYSEHSDDLVMSKLRNLLSHVLYDVEIYICGCDD